MEKVALVTGASRGIGRGIAVTLGAAGWTVWVTGRSSHSGAATSHLPGTVEATAGAVTAAGGLGVAAVCDHRDDDQVRSVVASLGDRLDLLVNNVWGGYERLNAGAWDEWTAPFWEQPLSLWDMMFDGGVRAHYVTTALCAPLLRTADGGLIVTVSADPPANWVAYSTAKAADEHLTSSFALALAPDNVASVALRPGLVRTEGVMQFTDHLDLSESQSPEGIGRVVAALAADPELMSLSGKTLTATELAARYSVNLS